MLPAAARSAAARRVAHLASVLHPQGRHRRGSLFLPAMTLGILACSAHLLHRSALPLGGSTTPSSRGSSSSIGASSHPTIVRMPGDGSCLFHALAAGSQQPSWSSDTLRSAICDELLKRRADIEPFISGSSDGYSFDEYVARMRVRGSWVGSRS